MPNVRYISQSFQLHTFCIMCICCEHWAAHKKTHSNPMQSDGRIFQWYVLACLLFCCCCCCLNADQNRATCTNATVPLDNILSNRIERWIWTFTNTRCKNISVVKWYTMNVVFEMDSFCANNFQIKNYAVIHSNESNLNRMKFFEFVEYMHLLILLIKCLALKAKSIISNLNQNKFSQICFGYLFDYFKILLLTWKLSLWFLIENTHKSLQLKL